MQDFFRRIWLLAWVRESVLMLIRTLAVQIALQLAALSEILGDGTVDIGSLETWAAATVTALITTILTQGAAILMTHFGKVVTVKAQDSNPPSA